LILMSKQKLIITSVDEAYVYSRIGMALISTQRVEFITSKLLEILTEFDSSAFGVTTEEFLETSNKSKNSRKTLGNVFKLLKLNPKLVIENELDNYLKDRNLFIHSFWQTYLTDQTVEQAVKATEFCYSFGAYSDRITSFFKGFIFFLALRNVKGREHVDGDLKLWGTDFEYFLSSLDKQHLE
jgi:hypothetical protein